MRRLDKDSREVKDLDISPLTLVHYPVLWLRPNGEVCGLHRLMFHWTVHVDIDRSGYRDRYCFATEELATRAFDEWSGDPGTDPDYWHRHPGSARRRDLATSEEWVEG